MGDLIHYERNLPHRLPPGSDIFLTFRLAGSLPAAQMARLQAQFSSTEDDTAETSYARQRRYFGKFDGLLDDGYHGPVWLRDRSIAEVVASSLRHFHGISYNLVCYCVMPNHVYLTEQLQ